jgi:hypothetical protein
MNLKTAAVEHDLDDILPDIVGIPFYHTYDYFSLFRHKLLGEVGLEDLDPLAALADDHARARGVDDDLGAVRGALDLDAGDVRVVEVLLDRALDAQILVQPLLVGVTVFVPLAAPRLDDADGKPIGCVFCPMCA